MLYWLCLLTLPLLLLGSARNVENVNYFSEDDLAAVVITVVAVKEQLFHQQQLVQSSGVVQFTADV